MARDDELYALVEADQRVFFPGGHPGKAQAIQLLLNPGYQAIWNDRSDGKRFCGFVSVRLPGAEYGSYLEVVPAEAWRVANGKEAWALLVESMGAELSDFDARLLERPVTREDAISLASAPDTMRQAEALVREAFARGAVFGAGACPQILWRAMGADACARLRPERSALDLDKYWREGLRGNWSDYRYKGRDMFAFSRSGDPPPGLKYAAEDFGEALTFDALRERGFVSATGLDFAVLENPYEPLVRVGRIGIVVQEVAPTRVVLGTSD